MSVDDTLRAAFAEETVEGQTGAALRQVHARVHRRRVLKGAVAGVATVGVLVAIGVTAGPGRPGADEPTTPVSTATATPVPGHPTTPTPLDGTWALGPVSAARIRATLRAAGDQQWYRTVMRDFPGPPLRYRMTIARGRVLVDLVGADGGRSRYDEEYLSVLGDGAELEPIRSIGVNRYRWALAGGRLRLTFVSTSEGKEPIGPDGAFQRALYTVGDWTRVGRR